MVMKIKSKGGKITNSRKGIAKLGYGNYVHIKTTGLLSNKRLMADIEYSKKHKLPSRTRTLQASEMEEMSKLTGSEMQAVYIEVDTTSKAYKEFEENKVVFRVLLELAVNIDGEIMGYELEDGTGCNIWTYLNVPKNSYRLLTEHLMSDDGMAMSDQDISIFSGEIKRISSGIKTYAQEELDALILLEEEEKLAKAKEVEGNADNI